ncbi:DUF1993 family protein [Erythrobacter sp. WG]|uniref:DUF1993 family protein n=1 Tax=Erythrobacter sp. WG TaxID=2985510 RepID=UPI00226E6E26|nr:DUF1993 family protein [Erythrobacter sp. WG]MCX9146845.1 DUF1993 domain-containing protein [Erythrobacter sp. WG]
MSYATAALATFGNVLGTLDHLVTKAQAHEKGEALLQSRLAPDMFALHTQIRFTIDQVLVALDRLGTLGLTLDAADITSFAEARARIAAAKAQLAATDPGLWPSSTEAVSFDLPNGMGFLMRAHEYCRDWSIPQAYFHLTATYAILRMEGVPLGKADFVGHMFQYARQPVA